MISKMNTRWAMRVLRSDNFAVVTDTQAALWLDIKHPKRLTSVVTLQYQRATLLMFVKRLQSLIRQHDKAIEKLRGNAKIKQRRSETNTKSKEGSM